MLNKFSPVFEWDVVTYFISIAAFVQDEERKMRLFECFMKCDFVKTLLLSISNDDKFWQDKYEEVLQGKFLHFETSLKNKNINQEIWKEIYLNPIYQEDGTIQEVSGIAHDITEKKFSDFLPCLSSH